jgi:hypothetical protein
MNRFEILAKATLHMYGEAVRDGSKSLVAHFWIIGLIPGYTMLLGLIGTLAMSLGFLGGILQYLAMAALLSSFLSIIGEAVSHQRVNVAGLGSTFGRYFNSLISVLFVFWILDLVLGMMSHSNANSLWLILFVKTAIFIVFNPVPELIYQGQRDGMGLLEDAYRFTLANTVEWLLPMFLILGPIFAIETRMGLVVMSQLSPTNALTMLNTILMQWLPTAGPWTAILSTLLASTLLTWIMLCRGFLFRSLNRGGRRQRIFQSRMES